MIIAMEFRCSTASLAELPCDGLALGLFSSNWQEQLRPWA
ncbi:MAG: hypothetical protein RLZZ158_1445, partial [Cyanobacteriota bacterium]